MDASIWCDPCEGYPSVYVKLKKADVAPAVHGTEGQVNTTADATTFADIVDESRRRNMEENT